jgi:hypothetical protein
VHRQRFEFDGNAQVDANLARRRDATVLRDEPSAAMPTGVNYADVLAPAARATARLTTLLSRTMLSPHYFFRDRPEGGANGYQETRKEKLGEKQGSAKGKAEKARCAGAA